MYVNEAIGSIAPTPKMVRPLVEGIGRAYWSFWSDIVACTHVGSDPLKMAVWIFFWVNPLNINTVKTNMENNSIILEDHWNEMEANLKTLSFFEAGDLFGTIMGILSDPLPPEVEESAPVEDDGSFSIDDIV